MNHNSTAIQIFNLYTKIRKIKFKIVKVSLENKSLTKGRLKMRFHFTSQTIPFKINSIEGFSSRLYQYNV